MTQILRHRRREDEKRLVQLAWSERERKGEPDCKAKDEIVLINGRR